MAEPAATLSQALPVATATYGLTILGFATGLDPILLFAGGLGGLWSLSYIPEPMSLPQRLTVGSIAALAGAWSAPWLDEAQAETRAIPASEELIAELPAFVPPQT